MKQRRILIILAAMAALALLVAACQTSPDSPSWAEPDAAAISSSPEPAPEEYTWSQLLARDAIPPIYEPRFVPAAEADYDDAELVMGVAIDGEAKAYPVGHLNRREIVNDELAGIPILVTW